MPVKRRRICTAVVLGPGLLAEALGSGAGTELGLLGGVSAAAAGARMGLLAEALGAAAGRPAMDCASGMSPGAAAVAAVVGLPP